MIENGHLQPYFLHMDLDAFFASVEQLDFPEYRGKPVIVGGFPSDRRSVVATCSYEARKFGVHSAMPIAQAYRLCPHAVYVRGRMQRYREKSCEVMSVLSDFSPDIRQISIDEACLDITGTERLFGAPEKTAALLKKRIFEKTKLTVSVGLASTKYLAKLASGMSKPDGFFFIRPGAEETFMLSLPLKKIWGIGNKTLEKLHASGLFTAQDVHAASENLLRSLFGISAGSFLYRVVRGLEEETSPEHAKSRSISSETTFLIDITDAYILETQLMSLSHDVMFRALEENVLSKTAHIKIRYEDFTTVSAQETLERNITTAKELYERVIVLFKKKYIPSRGVRLLGVALQNIDEKAEKQGELFDGKRNKQEALEKTLLELRHKHPQVQVQKARLLDPSKISKKKTFTPLSVLLPFFFTLFIFFSYNAQAQISLKDLPKPLQAESPTALFQYTKDDTAVEFLANGSWESKLMSSATFTFEKNKALRVQFDPVIFTQKADLSLWFLLNRQWYFEANFVDGYNKNSVAAGYYGEGVLKHARAGNSGIVFPERYDTLIGGGDIISPGLMTDFAGNKWQANAAVRYDSAEYGEKVFSGSNELSSQSVPLGSWTRGTRFVLPSSAIASDIRDIYVEDDKSSYAVYSDSQGRKYRKLQPSDYFVLPSQALLILSSAVRGRIAVTFFTQTKTSLMSVLGKFGEPSAVPPKPRSGFFGDVQEFFGSAAAEVPEVWKFSYPASKDNANDFFINLSNGVGETLILYDYPLFSPFEAANRYNMGSSSGNLSVIHSASGAAEPLLRAVFTADALTGINDASSPVQENRAKISWAEVYRTDFTPPSGEPPLTSPKARYPAADISPLSYLQPSSPAPQGTDLAVKAENFTPAAGYTISTDAIPGTIRVYRNGMLDTAYTYKPLTGEILFFTRPSVYDTIRVTWLENNTVSKNASLAAAIGFTYDILPQLHFITSISTRWSFSEQKYSDAGSSLPGTAEAAAKIEWKRDDLLLSNTIKGSLEVQDVTGVHRVLGMDDSQPRTLYLLEDSAVSLPEGIAPVINIAGTTPNPLDYAKKMPMQASVVNGAKYGIQGYAVEMNWNFDGANQWAAETLDLGSSASELQSASRFSILLRGNALPPTGSKLYLQLGVSAKTDFTFENTASIRTWEITNTIPAGNGWKIFTVELTDADRSLLSVNKNARIVAVAPSPSSAGASGSLVAGYARLSGISFAQTAGKPVIIEQTPPPVPLSQASRFNENGANTVLHLQWGKDQPWVAGDFAEITRFIPALPFSSYKTLNFYALNHGTPQTADREILIEFKRRDEDTGIPYTVLSYTKNVSDFPDGSWEQVSIPLPEIDSEDSPTQVVITLKGNGGPGTNPQGSLYLDEFFLEGTEPQYRFENTAEFKWESSMPLISAGNFIILEKPKAALKSSVAVTTQHNRVKTGIDARAEAGLTLLKTDLGGFIYKDQEKNRAFESAGHNLKSNWPIINIAENYVFHAASRGTQKKDSIEIGANILDQPFLVSFITEGAFIHNYTKQNAQIKLDAAFPIKESLYSLRAEFHADQLRPDTTRAEEFTYGSAWTDASRVQFSAGNADAQTRQAKGRLHQSLKLPFAGFLPAIELEALSRYTAASSVIHTDHSSALFEFPFIAGQNQLRLFWIKGAGAEKPVTSGGNYVSDARLYGQSAARQTWLYTSPPIADLFLPSIANSMQEALKQTPFLRQSTLLYESKYGFSFQKPAFFSMADLFVPSKLTAQYGKEIRVSTSEISERFLAETSWALAAYNVFGRFSKRPVFNWYEQDEIIQSYNVSISYGNNFLETYKITAGAYISAILFFNEKDFFKSENSFQFQNNGDWKLLSSLQLNYGGKKSFISAIALLVRPSLAEKLPMTITRKDTLTYSAAKGTELYQEITFAHALSTAITEIISFSAEAGIIVTAYEKKVTVSPQVSVSGKLTF